MSHASETRARDAVVAWLRAESARARASGFVAFDTADAEWGLIERWVSGTGIEIERAAAEGRSPLHTAADLLHERPDRLPLSLRTKGRLLLDGPLPVLHPLGDLWGFEMAEWGIEALPPSGFQRTAEWREVERALARALDGGVGLRPALAVLGDERATRVEARVVMAASRGRIRLPKLGWWTLGVDPPLG